MELLIPPRHKGLFPSLKDQLTNEHTKCGPITWHGYLRVVTDNQDVIDQLKQKLDAQPTQPANQYSRVTSASPDPPARERSLPGQPTSCR